jgi:hypothetical protein
MFLFKCYWCDTNTGIKVDHHHGLLEENKNDKLRNINNIFIFVKQYQKIYYIYTSFFRNDHDRVDWLSIIETESKSRV